MQTDLKVFVYIILKWKNLSKSYTMTLQFKCRVNNGTESILHLKIISKDVFEYHFYIGHITRINDAFLSNLMS